MYCPLNNIGRSAPYSTVSARWGPIIQKQAPSNIDWRAMEPHRQPSEFGPHYWYMLHSMALNYPMNPTEFAKKKMKAFIEAIPFLLPCRDCTEHAKEFMASANVDEALLGKKQLFTFFWNFHNLVNKRLGKQSMPFNDALNMYSTQKVK